MNRQWRVKRTQAVEPGAAEQTADRGAAEGEFPREPPIIPAQAAGSHNLCNKEKQGVVGYDASARSGQPTR